jgi:hypothetical protein
VRHHGWLELRARARIVNGARGLTAEQSDTFGVYAAVRKPSSQNDLGK